MDANLVAALIVVIALGLFITLTLIYKFWRSRRYLARIIVFGFLALAAISASMIWSAQQWLLPLPMSQALAILAILFAMQTLIWLVGSPEGDRLAQLTNALHAQKVEAVVRQASAIPGATGRRRVDELLDMTVGLVRSLLSDGIAIKTQSTIMLYPNRKPSYQYEERTEYELRLPQEIQLVFDFKQTASASPVLQRRVKRWYYPFFLVGSTTDNEKWLKECSKAVGAYWELEGGPRRNLRFSEEKGDSGSLLMSEQVALRKTDGIGKVTVSYHVDNLPLIDSDLNYLAFYTSDYLDNWEIIVKYPDAVLHRVSVSPLPLFTPLEPPKFQLVEKKDGEVRYLYQSEIPSPVLPWYGVAINFFKREGRSA